MVILFLKSNVLCLTVVSAPHADSSQICTRAGKNIKSAAIRGRQAASTPYEICSDMSEVLGLELPFKDLLKSRSDIFSMI